MKRQHLKQRQQELSQALQGRREWIKRRIESGRYQITPLTLVLCATGAGVVFQLAGLSPRHLLTMSLA